MTFSDKDLDQLKWFLNEPIHSAEELDKFFGTKGAALIARLESAEKVLGDCAYNLEVEDECQLCDQHHEYYRAWRKAKGDLSGSEEASGRDSKGADGR
jgi:hypothetical protein